MNTSKADLLLHPVRLRIALAFAGGMQGRRLTAQQLAEELADVPPATLYRHLNKLVAGGLLAIVEERQVRGAMEKIYALPAGAARLTAAEAANLSREDHMRMFTVFVSSLLGDFSRYLNREHIDLTADGVGYTEVALYLSDEEFRRLVEGLNATIRPALANPPTASRTRRTLATIIMPAPEKAEPGADAPATPAES